ncbi:GntR family transcriptional regulator [Paraburkholderia bengalensis]|uniref:GntR family transcriptional regulator n=1 Tax=Paraburkholderia bengalensis TaxID=2747562 RepID=A0ABU8J3J8_9BURK
MPSLAIEIDRTAAAPVGEQIYASLRQLIIDGGLQPGRRLPSGRDLAAQPWRYPPVTMT